jgi:hypothetical protein
MGLSEFFKGTMAVLEGRIKARRLEKADERDHKREMKAELRKAEANAQTERIKAAADIQSDRIVVETEEAKKITAHTAGMADAARTAQAGAQQFTFDMAAQAQKNSLKGTQQTADLLMKRQKDAFGVTTRTEELNITKEEDAHKYNKALMGFEGAEKQAPAVAASRHALHNQHFAAVLDDQCALGKKEMLENLVEGNGPPTVDFSPTAVATLVSTLKDAGFDAEAIQRTLNSMKDGARIGQVSYNNKRAQARLDYDTCKSWDAHGKQQDMQSTFLGGITADDKSVSKRTLKASKRYGKNKNSVASDVGAIIGAMPGNSRTLAFGANYNIGD